MIPASVRGRLGPIWGRAFLYVTGGLAIGKVESSVSATTEVGFDTTYAGSVSQTRLGGVVGAGIEYAFTDRVSAKVEYLPFDLGSVDYVVTAVVPTVLPATWNASAKVSGDIFRRGSTSDSADPIGSVRYSASRRVRSISTLAAVVKASN